jgi:hypothetical protein
MRYLEAWRHQAEQVMAAGYRKQGKRTLRRVEQLEKEYL